MDEENQETSFDIRCAALAELWTNYRSDPQLEDFIDYNDIGLPAAFLVENNLADPSEQLIELINETFTLLLTTLGIERDTGFEDLDQILTDAMGP